MRKPALIATGLALATLAATTGCSVFSDDKERADLQVYSARHYGSEEVFKQFTEETGITVDFLSGENADLLERIKAEGKDSPADIYMTVDAGNLWHAAEEGILAPVTSTVLDDAVPQQYRDSQDRWFGLVLRARTVLYNPDNVKESELDPKDTYAGLADPKWKGRICMRDDSEAYTVSLVASLIDLYGHDRALEIVKGWVANDVEVMANDVLLIDAVDAGTCDVALVNHYYLARELAERPDLDVKLYWASQEGAGTHVNISGAGIVKTSDNKEKAQELLEWLATKGQDDMIAGNHEFPVNPDVQPDAVAAGFGSFKPMPIDAEAYGSKNAEAIDLLAEAGYE
jgi:iron(III) transport system substrate-binding protein